MFPYVFGFATLLVSINPSKLIGKAVHRLIVKQYNNQHRAALEADGKRKAFASQRYEARASLHGCTQAVGGHPHLRLDTRRLYST